jgi:hypothetical protein
MDMQLSLAQDRDPCERVNKPSDVHKSSRISREGLSTVNRRTSHCTSFFTTDMIRFFFFNLRTASVYSFGQCLFER